MSEVITVFGSYTVAQVITFFIAIGVIFGVCVKVYQFAVKFHDSIQEQQEKINKSLEGYHEMREHTDSEIRELSECIKEIKDDLRAFNDRMDIQDHRQEKEELRQKKYRMTSLHDRLFQAHRYFMGEGKISPRDLDNWTMIYSEYRENDGNGTVENKLNPEILALPIDYDDPSEIKI